jgi:hypothetical protein
MKPLIYYDILMNIRNVQLDRSHRRTQLFGKIRKDVKREKLMKITCFQSQMLGFFTYDKPLRRYTLYIINSKYYGDVAMLTRQRKRDVFPWFPIVPVSPSLSLPLLWYLSPLHYRFPYSENTSPFRCDVNVATSH